MNLLSGANLEREMISNLHIFKKIFWGKIMDFSSETMEVRRKWNNISQVLKEKNRHPESDIQ